MRKLFSLITLLGLAFGCMAFANEVPIIEKVVTHHENVCLQIGDSWLITQGLQADSAGTFVLMEGQWIPLSEAVAFGDFQASWTCSRCGRNNMDGVTSCPYCGSSRDG